MFLIRNFVPDPVGSRRVGQDRVADLAQPGGDRGLGLRQVLLGVRCTRVHDRPRRQHDRHRPQCLVGVLDRSAAHPAGVVGHDAADRGGRLRRRVGPEPVAVALEGRVGPGQDRAGLAAQGPAAVLHGAPDPVAHDLHEDPVALGLPGQAGPRRAERHRDRVRVPVGQDLLDVADVAGQDHDLREHPVGAGVGGEADEVEPAAEHHVRVAQELLEILAQLGSGAGGQMVRGAVGGGCRVVDEVRVQRRARTACAWAAGFHPRATDVLTCTLRPSTDRGRAHRSPPGSVRR